MINIYIVYHSEDMDGWLSAYIANKYYKDAIASGSGDVPDDSQVHFIPYNRGKIPTFEERSIIVMCDIVLQPIDELTELCKTNDVIIIDHHKTNIDMVQPLIESNLLKGHNLSTEKGSACKLTWNYYYPNKKLPELVKIASDYDSWNNVDEDYFNNRCIPFSYQSNSTIYNPISPEGKRNLEVLWATFENGDFFEMNKFFDNGSAMRRYQQMAASKAYENTGFETTYGGLRIVGMFFDKGSDKFKGIYNPDNHDVMCSIRPKLIDGEIYFDISFYTDKDNVDVSELAKQIDPNAGGHKGAAGMPPVKEIPFLKGVGNV